MKDEIKIHLCRRGARMPEIKTDGSAGYDCFCPEDTVIRYGRQIIPTGNRSEFSPHIRLDCRTRAGYAAYGLSVTDRWGHKWRVDADVTLGLIDSDYRGEIGVILNVRSLVVLLFGWLFKFRVVAGQALAQFVFSFVPNTELILTNSLSNTERGEKGFGEANDEGKK